MNPTPNSNHLTNNILTRGNMNISALTKGFVLPYFKYEIIIKKRGGSGAYAYKGTGYYELERDLEEIKKKKLEVDVIKVYVDWNKKINKYGKEIYVELVEKKIEATLLEKTKEKYKITVSLINEENKEGKIEVEKL